MQIFNYGRPVADENFVNRTEEITRLQRNIKTSVNTVMISPRRWGKSSLVERVRVLNEDRSVVFCMLDLFKVRTEEQFHDYFTTSLISSTHSKIEEAITAVKKWLSSFSPSISFSGNENQSLTLKLERASASESQSEIFNLPEQLAVAKGIHLIVCLDEFQNIGEFSDPLGFQKTARAYWQHHKNVTYILYGSKRHMMMQLFEDKNMPFYRFGDMIYLEKISSEHFVPFIEHGFSSNGKKIKEGVAEALVSRMANHPYYVQQLAHILYYSSGKKAVNFKALDRAMEELLLTNALFYSKEFEGLPDPQIKVLRMLVDGVDGGYTKGAVIKNYGFNSSAHVIAAISALEKKEIIERFGDRIEFVDPVFSFWLKHILEQ